MNRHDFFRRVAGATVPPPPATYGEDLVPLNIQAGLEVYAEPLDERRVAHFLRRTSFGARPDQVQALQGAMAEDLVDALIDEARLLPLPSPPPWADEGVPDDVSQAYIGQNGVRVQELRGGWLQEMYRNGFREKMALFWHNHFVTDVAVYTYAPVAHRYLNLLRTHALGDFKQFVYDIGLDLAMLIYLDGTSNIKTAPNENYARELLELFTMSPRDALGNVNYTETDIQEIARALTGWKADVRTLEVTFQSALFDDTDKTFFERTGNFGYDEVIDIVFEERAEVIAQFVVSKIYKEFIYAAPDEDIVQELEALFIAEGFQIAPVIRTLLKSAHFFDDEVIGARIKSPTELIVGMLIEMHAEPDPDAYGLWAAAGANLGQHLLSPPTVAGWDGHHAWLNTAAVTTRWFTTNLLIFGPREQSPVDLLPLAEQLYDPSDPLAPFHLPVKMIEHFSSVPVDLIDMGVLEEPFGGDLEGNPVPNEIVNAPPHVQNIAKLFLDGTPWYEWSLEAEGANNRLRSFLRYVSQLPEFHLS